jgi:hypothetical protein
MFRKRYKVQGIGEDVLVQEEYADKTWNKKFFHNKPASSKTI